MYYHMPLKRAKPPTQIVSYELSFQKPSKHW